GEPTVSGRPRTIGDSRRTVLSPSAREQQKFAGTRLRNTRPFYQNGAGFSSTSATYKAEVSGGGFALTGVAALSDSSSGDGHGGSAVLPRSARPISFETTSLGRSGTKYPLGSAFAVDDAGGVSLRHGTITEHLESTLEGISQSWEIPTRPEGEGDFVVHIQVEGQSYASETAGGLHFVDPEGGLGTVYGHGTWIDHAGTRTRVVAHYADGSIELRVPAEFIRATVYPALQ